MNRSSSPRSPRASLALGIVLATCVTIASFEIVGFHQTCAYAQPLPKDVVRPAQCVAISADAKLVAAGKSGQSNGTIPLRPHPDPNKCGVILVWDAATARVKMRAETFGDLTKLAFSPDAKLLYVSRLYLAEESVEMNEVSIWDIESGKQIKSLDRTHAFALTPDGKTLAVASRFRCQLYDARGELKQRQFPPLKNALALAFSPNGLELAGIVEDEGKFRIRACEVAKATATEKEDKHKAGKEQEAVPFKQTFALDDPFYNLAFSPDGKSLASGHRGSNVLVWNFSTLAEFRGLNASTTGLQDVFFNPRGDLLATASQENGTVVIWEFETGKELHRYTYDPGTFRTFIKREEGDRIQPEKSPARFVFLPSGEAFFSGCFGGVIRKTVDGGEVQRYR